MKHLISFLVASSFYVALVLMIVGTPLLIFKDSRKVGAILFITGVLMIGGYLFVLMYIISGLNGG
ncbi:MAG: hypothetical protein Q7R75_02510 [bacterium]|nr:hypothetical protein [bacterium]